MYPESSLVNARFSFPIRMQLLFKRYFEHAIITCHCVISGNAKLTPNKLGGAFGDGPVMFSLRSTIAQAQ